MVAAGAIAAPDGSKVHLYESVASRGDILSTPGNGIGRQGAASPGDTISKAASSIIPDLATLAKSLWNAVAGDDLRTMCDSKTSTWKRALAGADLASSIGDPLKGGLETAAKVVVKDGLEAVSKHLAGDAVDNTSKRVVSALADDASVGAAKATAKADAVAIAGGHAWQKHESEFPGWTRADFQKAVERTVEHPDGQKTLARGRTAYWSDAYKMIVIRDRASPDAGTAFRPKAGKDYFEAGLE